MSDGDRDVETARSQCFELAAAAFAGDMLDLERYEALAVQIAEAHRLAELQAIRESLPEVKLETIEEPQLLTVQSSSIRRTGRWVTSRSIRLASTSSTVKLDFTDYSEERDFRLMLDLDCRSSSVRLTVPESIDVIEEIESRRASVFRDKHRPGRPKGAILVTGTISSCNIKVVRKRSR